MQNWGIVIPEEVNYAEYLQKHNPDQFYYIDICPYATDSKYSQFELQFQDISDGIDRKRFYSYEMKFVDVLSVLWLYNDVFVSSDIGEKKKSISKKINRTYKENFQQLYSTLQWTTITPIKNLKDLELLVQLGSRQLAETEFYFKQYELLVVPSWSCFILYMNDLSKKDIVEKIINTHGLFLRKLDKTLLQEE